MRYDGSELRKSEAFDIVIMAALLFTYEKNGSARLPCSIFSHFRALQQALGSTDRKWVIKSVTG